MDPCGAASARPPSRRGTNRKKRRDSRFENFNDDTVGSLEAICASSPSGRPQPLYASSQLESAVSNMPTLQSTGKKQKRKRKTEQPLQEAARKQGSVFHSAFPEPGGKRQGVQSSRPKEFLQRHLKNMFGSKTTSRPESPPANPTSQTMQGLSDPIPKKNKTLCASSDSDTDTGSVVKNYVDELQKLPPNTEDYRKEQKAPNPKIVVTRKEPTRHRTSLALSKQNGGRTRKRFGSSKPIVPGASIVSTRSQGNDHDGEYRRESTKTSKTVGSADQPLDIDDDDEVEEKPKPVRKSARVRASLGSLRDTDDEEDNAGVHSSWFFNPRKKQKLVMNTIRLCFGKRLVRSSGQCVFDFTKAELRLAFKVSSDIMTRKASGERTTTHIISFSDLIAVKYYYSQATVSLDNDDEDVEEDPSFLALKVYPTSENGLTKYSNYDPNDPDVGKSFVLVEFQKVSDMVTLSKAMQKSDEPLLITAPLMNFDDAKQIGKLLWTRKKERSSLRLAPKKDQYFKGLDDDEIILIYPFCGDKAKIEAAASDLTEAHGADPVDLEPTRGRAHYLTIRVGDYARLDDGEFLNDTLIDFWMQWISRHNDRTNLHFFSSHFYSTLVEEGVAGVTKWTQKKGINIFDKKFVFIPINKSLHWSLCVVINPGAIENVPDDSSPPDSPYPCILFFDSLKAHRSSLVAKNVRKWLNSEWARLTENDNPEIKLFNAQSMPVYSPKIPYQNNSWDCGVFVCRYAYAMYLLRDKAFSLRDVNEDAKRSFSFTSLITEAEAFAFDMSDIVRIRQELKTLIRNLSKVFIPWREEEARKEKEAAKKEKQDDGTSEKNGEEAIERATDEKDDSNDNSVDDAKDGMAEEAKPVAKESKVTFADTHKTGGVKEETSENAKPSVKKNDVPSTDDEMTESAVIMARTMAAEKIKNLRKTLGNESPDPMDVDKASTPSTVFEVEDPMDIDPPVESLQKPNDVVEIVDPPPANTTKPVLKTDDDDDSVCSITNQYEDKMEANEIGTPRNVSKVLEVAYAPNGFIATAQRNFLRPSNNNSSPPLQHPGQPREISEEPPVPHRSGNNFFLESPLHKAVSYSDEKSDSMLHANAMDPAESLEVEFMGSRTSPKAYPLSDGRADGTSRTRYSLGSGSKVSAMLQDKSATSSKRGSLFPYKSICEKI